MDLLYLLSLPRLMFLGLIQFFCNSMECISFHEVQLLSLINVHCRVLIIVAVLVCSFSTSLWHSLLAYCLLSSIQLHLFLKSYYKAIYALVCTHL